LKKEKAMFMAVIMAESNAFRSTVDNMEYSIDELKENFKAV
jgi:predicted chitinase